MPTRPLTNPEKQEFFDKHLPWKLAALTSYTQFNETIYHALPSNRDALLSALSFAHCVAGRLLLEFLGLTYSKGHAIVEKEATRYDKHDVTVEDLGGRFVKKSDLQPGEEDILLAFLRLSNRNAHFTYDFRIQNGDESMWPARTIIERLLNDHLYSPTGQIKKELE